VLARDSTGCYEGGVRWYAIAVRARQEKGCASDLLERGFEVLLPLRVERHAWSDRVKSVEVALFPGYLFVRAELTAERRVELLRAPGTVELVGRLPGDERIAQSIPGEQIDSLRTLVDSGLHLDPVSRLVKGVAVVVATGALRGAQGIVVEEPDGARRLVVQIELLGRGVRASLSAEDVVEQLPSGRT
jgi:transcription termination/antitermination protein NusG